MQSMIRSRLILVVLLLSPLSMRIGNASAPIPNIHGDQPNLASRTSLRPPTVENILWRAERVCGVNCIYLLLRHFDRQADYGALETELVRDDFTSLVDLKRAATTRGLATTIAKTDHRGLELLPKPLIAHLDIVSPRGVASGHFVLVTQIHQGGNVIYIDGTTAEPRTSSWQDFERDWSGYVVVTKPFLELSTRMNFIIAGLGALVGYFMAQFRRRLRSSTKVTWAWMTRRVDAPMTLVGFLLIFVSSNVKAAEVVTLDSVGRVYQTRFDGIRTIHAEYQCEQTPLLDQATNFKARGVYENLPSTLTCVITDDGRRYQLLKSSEHSIGDVLRVIGKQKKKVSPLKVEDVSIGDITAALKTFRAMPFHKLGVYDGTKLWRNGSEKVIRNGIEHSVYKVVYIPRLKTIHFAQTPLDWGFWSFRMPAISKDDEQARRNRIPDKFEVDQFSVLPASERIGDDDCIVLTAPQVETIWLSLGKGFAPRKREFWMEGHKVFVAEFAEWKLVKEGAWLAGKVVTTSYGTESNGSSDSPDKPLYRTTYQLTKLEINSPASEALFQIEPKAGDMVLDENLVSGSDKGRMKPREGGGVTLNTVNYQTPAKREDLDRVIKNAVENDRERNAVSWSRRPAFWIIVMVLIGLAVVAIRHFRQK